MPPVQNPEKEHPPAEDAPQRNSKPGEADWYEHVQLNTTLQNCMDKFPAKLCSAEFQHMDATLILDAPEKSELGFVVRRLAATSEPTHAKGFSVSKKCRMDNTTVTGA
ncbi:hypothetical protein HPB50_004149 [Hyalomma asiaticum]|uniref:Uncharacterized protein n=1 Tax=Hyalomma asiaticum TaxID=266040 RepID=A0ACB7SDZ6_HYAAI|nr:hypothetical protein HPB50_004149 [Hyalomma asiaticum]